MNVFHFIVRSVGAVFPLLVWYGMVGCSKKQLSSLIIELVRVTKFRPVIWVVNGRYWCVICLTSS